MYNFKFENWHNDIIESLPRKPSKCDVVLKCEDGQVHLPSILLAISTTFWKDMLTDIDYQSVAVILIPDFKKDTVKDILEFLMTGELKTECCREEKSII